MRLELLRTSVMVGAPPEPPQPCGTPKVVKRRVMVEPLFAFTNSRTQWLPLVCTPMRSPTAGMMGFLVYRG